MSRQRPKVSRKTIVLIVSLCFLVAAVLIPVSLHLPRLVEFQIVLGVWWVAWAVITTVLLYQGHKVADDAERPDLIPGTTSDLIDKSGCNDIGCGWLVCGDLALIFVAGVLLIAGVLALIEFVVPAIALLLLWSIGGMFARAVNDTHDCQGNLPRSLFWGGFWATLYVGTVAVIVLFVADLLASRS